MQKAEGLKRVDVKYPGFSKEFTRLQEDRKYDIVMCAIEYAVLKSSIEEEIVKEAQQCLKRPNFGQVSFAKIDELKTLRDSYDEKYFEYQETNADLSKEFFINARAISSLIFAVQAKTDDERLESIYEASFVEEDDSKFGRVLKNDEAIHGCC